MKSFNIILEIKNINHKSHEFNYNNTKNVWLIESNIDSDEISEHWDEIENKLNVPIESLIHNTMIKIIIYDTLEEMPPVFIPSSMLKFAGEVHANIDVLNHKDFLKEVQDVPIEKNNTFNSPIQSNTIPDDFFKKE